MFVIFREQTPEKEDYVLDKIFFWTMPQSDLQVAEQYWNNIKQCVNENHIAPEYFWKIGDHKLFHVRPKGKNKQDLASNPHGGEVQKYCYWFNNEYITDIVNKNKQ
jgi:DNA mismatch repair protein MutH